jgi:hypothetical protein
MLGQKPSSKQDILSQPYLPNLNLPLIKYHHLGVIKSVNPAWLRLTGFKSKQIIGHTPPYPFQPQTKNQISAPDWVFGRRTNKPRKVMTASHHRLCVLIHAC